MAAASCTPRREGQFLSENKASEPLCCRSAQPKVSFVCRLAFALDLFPAGCVGRCGQFQEPSPGRDGEGCFLSRSERGDGPFGRGSPDPSLPPRCPGAGFPPVSLSPWEGTWWWHMAEQPRPRHITARVVGSTQAVWDPHLRGQPDGDPGCGAVGQTPLTPLSPPFSLGTWSC